MKVHCTDIKMYVAGVLAKIGKDIPKRIFPKMSRNKSFYFIPKFEQFIVLPKLEYQFKVYHDWQSAFDLRIRKHRGLSRNFDNGGLFYLKAIRFKIPKQFRS